jgi:hypothetical protein
MDTALRTILDATGVRVADLEHVVHERWDDGGPLGSRSRVGSQT